MPEMQKWRYDTKPTAMMVEDMTHDPILAAKVLLGLRIPPHQQLRIMMMWTTHYTQDDSGFSTGKSTTHAIVSAIRSILFPHRISGVLSGTFRQGKLIFANFDKWYNSSKIFRSCVRHAGGKPRITHGSDSHQIFFRGGSEIRVLPPNFISDSVRLQSERWHDGYFDEWPSFSMHALTKTIFGRVTAVNPDQECPIRQNHIHLCGTPGFTHSPAYKLVKKVQQNVSSGNPDYFQFTSNYRHVPQGEEWRGFVDRKVIFTMQQMNPPGIVGSEIDGIWQKDSMSFYSSRDIEEARFQNTPALMQRQKDNEYYVAAFDSARGGGNQNSGRGDDFSLTVLRITDHDSPPHHVFTRRRNNVTSKQMAAFIHDAHRRFQFSFIVYDPGGGGLFVKDELKEYTIDIGGEETSVTPIIEMGDPSGVIGDSILIPFKRSFYFVDQLWGKMASDSVLINRVHKAVVEALQNNKFLLAGEWDKWDHVGSAWDVDAKRDWLNKNKSLSEVDRLRAEMDLAVCQLVQVDVARNKAKEPIIDSYGMYKFESKNKKDSAYSLIYAYFAYMIWKNIQTFGGELDSDGEDTVYMGAI